MSITSYVKFPHLQVQAERANQITFPIGIRFAGRWFGSYVWSGSVRQFQFVPVAGKPVVFFFVNLYDQIQQHVFDKAKLFEELQ